MSIGTSCLAPGLALLALATPAFAAPTPMTEFIEIPRTDVVNVGVNGVGAAAIDGGGVGTIELAGVSGTVTMALLYWHGIDIEWPVNHYTGGNADYDEADIVFDGVPLTGTRIAHHGDNNGWPSDDLVTGESPPDSGALYRADVTDRVMLRGNGTYAISGLSDGAGHSTNGASLIVYFDDGDPANDLRVRHYEGLQANRDADWNLPFEVDYQGGSVDLVLHVADGQTSLNDGEFTFEVSPGVPGETDGSNTLDFAGNHYQDGLTLFGGLSVPGMGFAREGARLWDIRDFPLTGAFGPVGGYEVSTDWDTGGEALSLLVAQVMQPADPRDPILTPNPFDFGDVIEDTFSAPHQFVLRNLLPHPIVISGTPTVTTDWYQIVAQTCSGQTLAPDATCTVDVRCAPRGFSFPGPQSLRVAWTRTGYARAVTSYASLSCHGVPATTFSRLEVAPYSHDFGDVVIGETSDPYRFMARNTGQLPVSITAPEVNVTCSNGADSERFKVVNDGCAALTLQPGQECPIDLVFHPCPTQAPSKITNCLFLGYSASDDESDNAKATLIGHAITDPNAIFRNGFE